jgi:hypothetical protein
MSGRYVWDGVWEVFGIYGGGRTYGTWYMAHGKVSWRRRRRRINGFSGIVG